VTTYNLRKNLILVKLFTDETIIYNMITKGFTLILDDRLIEDSNIWHQISGHNI